MSLIRVYDESSMEYRKLELFADIATDFLLNNSQPMSVSMKTVYFDVGQDWKYTALITNDYGKGSSWQSVNPRDYENIVSSDSFSEIEGWAITYAQELMNGNISIKLTF